MNKKESRAVALFITHIYKLVIIASLLTYYLANNSFLNNFANILILISVAIVIVGVFIPGRILFKDGITKSLLGGVFTLLVITLLIMTDNFLVLDIYLIAFSAMSIKKILWISFYE